MIDFSMIRDVVFRLISQQSHTESAMGKEAGEKVNYILNKVIQREALNDEERVKAVNLVRDVAQSLTPEHGQRIKALIENVIVSSSISGKEREALEQIKEIL